MLGLLMFIVFGLFWSIVVLFLSVLLYVLGYIVIGVFVLVGLVGVLVVVCSGYWSD